MEARLDPLSHDVVEDRREALLHLFPEARSEGAGSIDFVRLRQALGDAVEDGPERFGMSWPGRAEAIRTMQERSIATLLPAPEESVDFDTTQNLIIEGDNLEVLKILQKSYLGKIKMIYIDPPYNTGNDFIYPDNYSESLQTYLAYTGQIDESGKRFSTNTEADGRFHSKWMSMMYPRLALARNLLTDDGVIFISIDRTEHANVRMIGERVFGDANLIGDLAVVNFLGGRSDTTHFATAHESLLVFARDAARAVIGGFELTAEQLGEYQMKDAKGPFKPETLRKRGSNSRREDAPSLFYPIYWNSETNCLSLDRKSSRDLEILPYLSDGSEGNWRWGKEKFLRDGATELIVLQTRGRATIYVKQRLMDESGRTRVSKPKTIWLDTKYNSGAGTRQIKDLDIPFPNPKPLGFIQDVVQIAASNGDIVLDFFTGSGTTGHAVLAQNAKDGGSRRFILVQLPEPVEEDSDAAKAGFGTIAEITKERVRRAAKGIAKEAGGASKLKRADGSGPQDLGFRVLKLAPSNFQVWDADAAQGDVRKLEEQLTLQVDHVLSGRSGLDVVFEVMAKSKRDLSSKVESRKVGKGEAWMVNGTDLVVVVDPGVDLSGIREIAGWKPTSAVILDRCFEGKDALKANARKIFEDAGVDYKTI